MYSESVIATRIERQETAGGLKLVRHPIAFVDEMISRIATAYDEKKKVKVRRLTKEELDFIRNETLMSMCDFLYWATRYCQVPLDGGGLGRFTPWQSQRIILDRYLAPLELEQYEKAKRGEIVEGIRLLLHKSRQLGATLFSRVATVHKLIFGKYLNAIAASTDERMVKELYDRDRTIYDHLPWWMRPAIKFDEKAAHIHFQTLDTKVIYEVSNQVSGLGTGRQFHISHLTECSSWREPGVIEFHFFPTIPLSLNTLAILESTANGRGNWWHEFTEDTRIGKHPEWTYVFIPWYACWKDEVGQFKYALTAPPTWKPLEATILHAKKVYDTSPEWAGESITLGRDQLYWYERGRESAREAGTLNYFLTSYCATPEESFQHSSQSAFSHELLEKIRFNTSVPETCYEVMVNR